ncbi:MAG: hypothetical protein ACXIU8_13090 [Alkalilacustris sp.]
MIDDGRKGDVGSDADSDLKHFDPLTELTRSGFISPAAAMRILHAYGQALDCVRGRDGMAPTPEAQAANCESLVHLAVTDFEEILEAACKGSVPGYATGRDMHASRARPGPPFDLTVQGLPRRRARRMSIGDALRAGPDAPAYASQGETG